MRNSIKSILGLGVLALLGISFQANAKVIMPVFGVSSEGTPVSFTADFAVDGDNLILVLKNTSLSPTLYQVDCLSSFYFDVYNGESRPTLSLVSAVGDTYAVYNDAEDVLQGDDVNLIASKGNKGPWQFKSMNPDSDPYVSFGLGTVGNSNLEPNSFNGNITGAINYSIYSGDWTTNNQSLKDEILVKDQITFTFSGMTGSGMTGSTEFTESDIAPYGIFGLGTGPDQLIVGNPPTPSLPIPTVPTPSAAFAGLSLLAGLAFASIRRKISQ